MKKLLTLTALGTIMMAAQANASGFNLKEQSVAAQGNAFAGATAGAEDISYSYFNAAGLTRHKGTKIVVGGTYIAPRSKARESFAKFPDGTTDGERYNNNIVHAAVAPNMYISHQLNDRWTLGASVNVPFGMITKYDDEWAGKYHGTLSKVTTVTVTPMAAYKANEHLSLGAGFQMQYIKARLRNSTFTPTDHDVKTALEGDTFDIGYQLGAMYEFNESTRIGAGYRSEVKHKLKGDIEFSPNNSFVWDQDISARLTTPANFTIGAYHDLNDQWSVMAEYGRTFWSSFDELRIRGSGSRPVNSVTEERWKDTDFYAFGVSYKYNDQWKFRAGVAYDEGAVDEEYRTPRIPDAGRQWYALGVQYTQNENLTWNVGYTYIRAKDGRVKLKGQGGHIGDEARGDLEALYKNDIHIFGLSLNYNF